MNNKQVAEIERWCTDYYVLSSQEAQKNAQLELDEFSKHPNV
jgi:hypothetical protein